MKDKRHSAGIFRIFSICVIVAGLCPWTALSAQKPASSISIKRCWEYPVASLSDKGISSDGMRAYLAEDGARLEAVSITDGSRIWFSDLGGEIISNVVEGNGALFVVTRSVESSGGKPASTVVRSLSKETGITNWVADVSDSSRYYLGTERELLIAVSDQGKAAALSTAAGAERWSTSFAGKITSVPFFSAGRFIVATDRPEILVVSVQDGKIAFRKVVRFRLTSVFLPEGDKGAWGDERGNLTLGDLASGKTIWKIKKGAAVSDIGAMGEMLLVTSDDNFVYAIASYNGGVRWKKRQTDRIYKPGILAGGFVVLSAKTGGTSQILEADRGRILDQIQLSAGATVVQFPIIAGDSILIPASTGLSAYSVTGCTTK